MKLREGGSRAAASRGGRGGYRLRLTLAYLGLRAAALRGGRGYLLCLNLAHLRRATCDRTKSLNTVPLREGPRAAAWRGGRGYGIAGLFSTKRVLRSDCRHSGSGKGRQAQRGRKRWQF